VSELSDEQVDAELSAAIFCYDPRDKYPEWSNAKMRDAYRAGRDDALAERREFVAVRSVEELDALPTYSLIRDIEDGTVWENHNGRWVWLIGPFHAQERKPLQHSPALVLYRPDWDTP